MVTGGLYLVQLFQCAHLSVFNQARREEWGPFPKGLSKKVGQHLPSPSSKISQLEEGSCHKFFTFFFQKELMHREGETYSSQRCNRLHLSGDTAFWPFKSASFVSFLLGFKKKERKRLKRFLLLSCMSTNGQLLLLWFTQILTVRNGKYYNKYNGS